MWPTSRSARDPSGSRETPGLTPAECVHVGLAFREKAGFGVENAVVERGAAEGLRFDHDAAQLALVERALRLNGAKELLAVQVAVAEVPSEDHAGDELAVEPLVLRG